MTLTPEQYEILQAAYERGDFEEFGVTSIQPAAKYIPTRNEFRAHAAAISLIINGVSFIATVKEFSTGALGWYLNDVTTVQIGDKSLTVNIGLNMTIEGTKPTSNDAIRNISTREADT